MPRTPVQEVAKPNPFITKTISKTLLTPCRQVGLSRKKKTPNSSNLNFLDNSLNLSDSANLDVDSTPLSSYTLKEFQEETLNTSTVQHLEKKDKRKSKVSKRLIEDEESCEQKAKQTPRNKKFKTINSFEAINEDSKSIDKKLNFEEFEDSTTRIIHSEEVSCENENAIMLSKKKTDCNKSKVSSKKRVLKRLNSDSDEESLESLKNVNQKLDKNLKILQNVDNNIDFEKSQDSCKNQKETKSRISPRKSNKKLDANYVYENDEAVSKRNLKVDSNKTRKNKDVIGELCDNNDFGEQLEKILVNVEKNKNEQKPLDDSAPENLDDGLARHSRKANKKSKKLKRCLSMKKSSEDQASEVLLRKCSITLTPLKNEYIQEDLITISEISEIQKLEKEVKQKRELIEELKQAEIYKKKHDVKELEDLTARWKAGCIQALNDLLPQLQVHGDFDMEMLLSKLNIPEDKIRLSPSGDLI